MGDPNFFIELKIFEIIDQFFRVVRLTQHLEKEILSLIQVIFFNIKNQQSISILLSSDSFQKFLENSPYALKTS